MPTRLDGSLSGSRPRGELAQGLIDSARMLGAAIGTLALLTALLMAAVFVYEMTQLDQEPAEALTIVAVAIAVGIIAMALTFVCARVYAKVLFSLLAVTLVTGGLAMLVSAPVVRQMNTPELAEYRGSNALTIFGALAIVLGLALAALCVRWSMRRHARVRLRQWARVLASVYGVVLGLSGLLGILALFALINSSATIDEEGVITSVVEQSIALTSIAMWSFVPGLLLTWHGISAATGEPSDEFRAPWPLLGMAAFAAVMLLGHWNMSSGDPIAAPMPLLHVLAAAIPGLTLASVAARASFARGVAVRGLTWRQVTLAAAISMAVATVIAIYVESIGSVYAVVLLLVHHGAFEFAANSDAVFDIIGESDFLLSDNEQFFAGLITAAVLAPVSEEFAKSLGVRFMMRPTTTRAQTFMLGAYAGAGFGFLEAMLYGLAGIEESLGDWWEIMLIRGGSTSLHVICTGLGGLAWWYFSRAQRHRLAAALFGSAIFIHAAWNGAFTVIDSRILGLDTLSDATLETIAYVIVGGVSAAMIGAIPLIARAVREPADTAPPQPSPMLHEMQVWLG